LVVLKIQQQSLHLLVDTGASDLVLLASATRDCQEAIKNIGTRTWSNMGGELKVQQVQLKDAYLGALPLGGQDVFILPDRDSPSGDLRGFLGLVSLKARRVGLDPEHRILGFERKAALTQLTGAVE
jgi:hypothetical protein